MSTFADDTAILNRSKCPQQALHVVAKPSRERAKTPTIYSRRIENLLLWSELYTNRKVSQKLRRMHTKTFEIQICLGEKAVKV